MKTIIYDGFYFIVKHIPALVSIEDEEFHWTSRVLTYDEYSGVFTTKDARYIPSQFNCEYSKLNPLNILSHHNKQELAYG